MSRTSKARVVVVIPCHNEATTLPSTFDRLVTSFTMMSTYQLEVLAVDDGSSDGTWDVIKSLQDRDLRVPVSGIRLTTNLGKGAAQALGIRSTPPGTWLVLMDADGQHDPSVVVDLTEIAQHHGAPCVAMRTNYRRRPTSAAGVAALRLIAGVLGVEFNPRESEFMILPPDAADAVRADEQLGVVPVLAVVHARAHPKHLKVEIQSRTGGAEVNRWLLSDLWGKALLHLLSNPWRTLPRLAAIAAAMITFTLVYGLWVGIQSAMNGTFLGVGSVIVLQAVLFSVTITFLLMIVGLLAIQFQSRALKFSLPPGTESFGPSLGTGS